LQRGTFAAGKSQPASAGFQMLLATTFRWWSAAFQVFYQQASACFQWVESWASAHREARLKPAETNSSLASAHHLKVVASNI